ncbi:MAG: ABC transporter permease, partial [Pseudomonadota bacterium]
MSAITDPRAIPADPVLPKRRSRTFLKLVRSPSALFGGVIVTFFLVVALLAPFLPVPGPAETDWSAVRKPPTMAHPFGTDEIGRDVLSRMIWGAQASLLAGVVSVLIAVVLGVPLGVLSGYLRGWTDAAISRVTEAMLAAPFLILAIALAAFLGPSLTNAMIAIGLSAMPIFIRLARAQTLLVMTEDYVESARAVGVGHGAMIGRYILPNIFPPILVQGTLTIATAIIAEASLSFLGLGQQPPS